MRWENDMQLGERISAVKKGAGKLDSLARERKFQELYKCLGEIHAQARDALYRMNDIQFK